MMKAQRLVRIQRLDLCELDLEELIRTRINLRGARENLLRARGMVAAIEADIPRLERAEKALLMMVARHKLALARSRRAARRS